MIVLEGQRGRSGKVRKVENKREVPLSGGWGKIVQNNELEVEKQVQRTATFQIVIDVKCEKFRLYSEIF